LPSEQELQALCEKRYNLFNQFNDGKLSHNDFEEKLMKYWRDNRLLKKMRKENVVN
jgi:hypothetical protein